MNSLRLALFSTEPWLDWDRGTNPKDDKRFIATVYYYTARMHWYMIIFVTILINNNWW